MTASVYLAAYAQVYAARGHFAWGNNTLKFALLTSAWSPTLQLNGSTYVFEANEWGDVSTHEVAAGSGYTAGGCDLYTGPNDQLAGYPKQVGAVTTLYAARPRWTNLTKTFRYGMLYVDDTLDGITKPLIAAYLFDNTPADVTVTAANFSPRWDPSGVWVMR